MVLRASKDNEHHLHEQMAEQLRATARLDSVLEAKKLVAKGAAPNSALFDDWEDLSVIEDLDYRAAEATQMAASGRYDAPLEIAAKRSNAEMVSLLLGAGARANRANPEGLRALHFAALAGSAPCAAALLKAGANPTLESLGGLTPLQAAVQSDAADGNVELVKLLLDSGAPINQVNRLGETALHNCVFNRNVSAFELLLERGADPTIKTQSGRDCASALGGYEHEHPDRALFDRMVLALVAREAQLSPASGLGLRIKARRIKAPKPSDLPGGEGGVALGHKALASSASSRSSAPGGQR